MSQPALPNRHLFPSSRTQLIVTAEELSLFQIYRAQQRGGGFGGNSTAAGTWDLLLWLLSPSQQAAQATGTLPALQGLSPWQDMLCYVTHLIPLSPPTPPWGNG